MAIADMPSVDTDPNQAAWNWDLGMGKVSSLALRSRAEILLAQIFWMVQLYNKAQNSHFPHHSLSHHLCT